MRLHRSRCPSTHERSGARLAFENQVLVDEFFWPIRPLGISHLQTPVGRRFLNAVCRLLGSTWQEGGNDKWSSRGEISQAFRSNLYLRRRITHGNRLFWQKPLLARLSKRKSIEIPWGIPHPPPPLAASRKRLYRMRPGSESRGLSA